MAQNCLFCQSFELPETLNKDNIDAVYSHFVADRETGKLPETLSCPYCPKSGMTPDSFLRHFRGHKTPLVTQNRALTYMVQTHVASNTVNNVPVDDSRPQMAPAEHTERPEINETNPSTLTEEGNVMADNSTESTGYFEKFKEALEKKIDASLEALNRIGQNMRSNDQDVHRHSVIDMLKCPTCGPVVRSVVESESDNLSDKLTSTTHLHNVTNMLDCPDCRPKVLAEAARILHPLVEATRRAPATETGERKQDNEAPPNAPQHEHVTADVLSCPECKKNLLAAIKPEEQSGRSKNNDEEHTVHSDVDSLLKCPYCGPQVILAVNRRFNRKRSGTEEKKQEESKTDTTQTVRSESKVASSTPRPVSLARIK